MKPYIVQAITDQNGQLIKSFGPRKAKRVISEKTARTLAMIMKTVIAEGGTGVNAALEGYSVCGKTGTAQKILKNNITGALLLPRYSKRSPARPLII